MELFDDRLLSERGQGNIIVLFGQLFETYWLVEYDEKFYIIDQHAAHEKVLYRTIYERYMKVKTILSQIISPPQIIQFKPYRRAASF